MLIFLRSWPWYWPFGTDFFLRLSYLWRKSSMFISSSSSLLPLNLKLILSSSQLLLLSLLNSSNLFWISWSLIFSSSSFTLPSLTWFALTCVNKFPSNWFLMSNCFWSLNVMLSGVGDSKYLYCIDLITCGQRPYWSFQQQQQS